MKISEFVSENFHFFGGKISVYLNRLVFVQPGTTVRVLHL